MTEVATVTDLTPTLTFIITCCTLLTIIAGFTIGMFNRFRKNMAADTEVIVQKALLPTTKRLGDMQNQIAALSDGVHAATELSLKHESDLSGKDGVFSRLSHLEGILNIKRIEPVSTVHDGGAK